MNAFVARALAFAAFVALLPRVGSATPGLGPGVIAAFVRDANGKPLSGALVIAEGPTTRQATTTRAGIVTLVALPIGTYAVSVTHAGYASLTRQVNVSSDPMASVLQVSVARTTFSAAQGIASAVSSVGLGSSTDALAGHLVATTQDAQLMPVRGLGDGVAPTLLGTSAGETRVELDGIPLAGGGSSLGALRLRNTIGLASVAFERGPVVETPTVRGAIGGIIDYRTADFASLSSASGEFGYSSTFGAFQDIATARNFGPIGFVADLVTGGGQNRTQTVKARYALSRSTTLDFASYGSQSAATVHAVDVTTNAPAYAADVRTSLGAAAVQVRAFSSSATTSSALAQPLSPSNETDRTHGLQASMDVPIGADDVSLSFDRRSDYAAYLQTGAGHTSAQTFTSVAARGDLRVSRLARLEVGDEYSGGTSLAPRNDPHVAFVLHPTDRVTIRASIGSSFATAPGDLLLAQVPGTQALQPETAFGYRVGIDDDLNGIDRLSASIFDLRRFDRFATYASARTFGIDASFAHQPLSSGLGGDAYLTLERANAFGALQPRDRVANELSGLSLTALEGDPFYTFRSHVSYRSKHGFSLGVASTVIGANNALATHSLGFVDASGVFSLKTLGQVRVGENNIFGTAVSDPVLESYYVPREFTILLRLGMASPDR